MSKNKLRDKVAIVTGASSGIGKATALALAHRGACVTLAARRAEALRELANEIETIGSQALPIQTDVTQQDQVQAMVQQTLVRWGQIDIVVANAGQYLRAPIENLELSLLEKSMAINFYAGVYTVLAVLPHMRARRSGHLVLISTVDAKKAIPPDAPYVAAKKALSGFFDVLRQELYGSGVYVTSIYPGRVDTPALDDLQVPWLSAKISPEVTAQAVVRAIERRQVEVILPFQAILLVYLTTPFPRLTDWIVRTFKLEGWASSKRTGTKK
jgi:NADP-dependent 3-hydroxy acid dehydrogenase YdfG